jgi:hypothetical protein
MTSSRSQEEEDDDEWLVVCRCEKAKNFYALLSCLRNVGAFANGGGSGALDSGTGGGTSSILTQSTASNRRQQKAGIQPVTVFCYHNSLTFHVMGKSKQVQASVNLQASSMFSEYNILQKQQQHQNEEKADEWHSEGEVRQKVGRHEIESESIQPTHVRIHPSYF